MKTSLLILLLTVAITSVVAQAPATKLPKLTTTDGTAYNDVTVTAVEAAGIRITHDSGLATIPWAQVPADLRTTLGYDPKKLVEAAKQAQAAAKAREPKARIGATPEEFQRAGCAFIGQNRSNLGSTSVQYQRGNYILTATFWRGTCHEIRFMDAAEIQFRRSSDADLVTEGKELTGGYNEFLKTVLDSNAGEAQWNEDKLFTNSARRWSRSDGQVTAEYIGRGRLTLTTKQWRDALSAGAQQQEKKSLDGF